MNSSSVISRRGFIFFLLRFMLPARPGKSTGKGGGGKLHRKCDLIDVSDVIRESCALRSNHDATSPANRRQPWHLSYNHRHFLHIRSTEDSEGSDPPLWTFFPPLPPAPTTSINDN